MYKMFKNPLKYQQGGQLNQEQQQMLAAFIDWLPKRVKEFEGMQPEAIVQALDGMSKTPEGQKQVQAYVEQFQNEMNGVASHKLGGKIQDFICKHAKGGHVGCGCTKKGEDGLVVDEPEGYTWGQYNKNDFLNSGENHIGWTKVTTPDGRTGWARNYRRKFLGIPSRNLDQILVTPDLEDGKYRSVGRGLNGFFGNGQIDTVYRFRNPEDDTKNRRNVVDFSLEGVAPERKQQGGRVNSGYEGMDYVTTNENEPGLGTLYTGWTREYIPGTRDLARSDMYGGQPEGLKYTFRRLINNGTIRDQIVDRNPENVSSIPNTTERLIQGTDTLYWPNRESFFKALTSKGTFAEGRPDWITLDQERNKYNASKKQDGGEIVSRQVVPEDIINVIKSYGNRNKYKSEILPNGSIEERAYPVTRVISPQQDTTLSVGSDVTPIILSPFSKLGKQYGPGFMDFTGNRTVVNPETWKRFNTYVDELKGRRLVTVPGLDKPQMTVKFKIK